MKTNDTIVALATSSAPSRRAIVRLSGPQAFALVNRVTACPPHLSSPVSSLACDSASGPGKVARSRAIGLTLRLAQGDHDAGLDVHAEAWQFFGPKSATGQDVVELHLPGSPFLIQRLLSKLYAAGARQADPGEFTARAFFMGKLTLDAAEGVVATISASNRAELDAARQLLAGELARRLAGPLEAITRTLALVEVNIDFSNEDVSFISKDQVQDAITAIDADLARLLAESTRFDRLTHMPQIVLVGRPNAGKSTLLNTLVGAERAVVSEQAGTTRDALNATVTLPSGLATLTDVAGLDDDGSDQATDAAIIDQMKASADRAILSAEVVVRVIDATDDRKPVSLPRPAALTVRTKADLHAPDHPSEEGVSVSARTGAGMEMLRQRLDELAFPRQASEQSAALALNARHIDAIQRARVSLQEAMSSADDGAELLSQDLRLALSAIGEIMGTVSPDDVLGRVFSTFCIGK